MRKIAQKTDEVLGTDLANVKLPKAIKDTEQKVSEFLFMNKKGRGGK